MIIWGDIWDKFIFCRDNRIIVYVMGFLEWLGKGTMVTTGRLRTCPCNLLLTIGQPRRLT